MIVVCYHPFTGDRMERDLPVTLAQLTAWRDGTLIQQAMPHLSIPDREWLITGLSASDLVGEARKRAENNKIRALLWATRLAQLTKGFTACPVPEYMHGAITRWVMEHHPPGDFLTALLKNDLHDAVVRADDANMHRLRNWVRLLYNFTPTPCCGSPAAFDAWERRGRRGEGRPAQRTL